ncbi:MAG TPA: hypothetical protein PKC19_00620 [Roseiflexaceae bacterium]|nr:hypothetical protein [Roseiflexaceae bacterium]
MYICVYCASSNRVADEFLQTARMLGDALARAGWPLVYGGGSVGLMGMLAAAAHAAGGM